MHDEQLALILTQLGYLCDRLTLELPEQDPDFSHEVNAVGRARILSHMIDDYLAFDGYNVIAKVGGVNIVERTGGA